LSIRAAGVRAAGARLYYGSPSFFVDATEALLLGRGGRIVQAAAGTMTELILAGAAGLALWLAPGAPAAAVLYQFAVVTYLSVLLNLTPLLELDGYWILADALGRPDLRRQSWLALKRLAGPGPHGRGQLALAAYGQAGIVFGAALLGWAAVFWLDVFGAPVAALWDGGVPGRLLLVAAGVVLVAGRLAAAGGAARAALRSGLRRLRFRGERRWRVLAAELVDALPGVGDLTEAELGELAGRLARRGYRPGEVVYERGTSARRLHVVATGTIELLDGAGRVVTTTGPGEAFGVQGLRDRAPRRLTARARGRAVLYELDRGESERLLERAAGVRR
jgi:putative peptide zinc metalloprotease protein